MSVGEEQIRCRNCKEVIPVEGGSCPHCGTEIRSTPKLLAAAAVGVVIALTSLIQFGDLWFFLVIGLAIVGIAGLLVYDKRQRMQDLVQQPKIET